MKILILACSCAFEWWCGLCLLWIWGEMGLVGLDSIWRGIEFKWNFGWILAHVAPRRLLCSCGEQSSEALYGDPICAPSVGKAPGDCPALVESGAVVSCAWLAFLPVSKCYAPKLLCVRPSMPAMHQGMLLCSPCGQRKAFLVLGWGPKFETCWMHALSFFFLAHDSRLRLPS